MRKTDTETANLRKLFNANEDAFKPKRNYPEELIPKGNATAAFNMLVGMLMLNSSNNENYEVIEETNKLIDRSWKYFDEIVERLDDEGLDSLAALLTAVSGASILHYKDHSETYKRKMQSILSGLNTFNETKGSAKERANEIASELWAEDTERKIRIGEMADLVYKKMLEEGFKETLPETIERMKKWIETVAPEYARRGGRSKKPSKRNG
nr:hypothetical protein [Pseudomonas luteola]